MQSGPAGPRPSGSASWSIHVGAMVDEQSRCFSLTSKECGMQRRDLQRMTRDRVDIRATFDQKASRFQMTVVSRQSHGCESLERVSVQSPRVFREQLGDTCRLADSRSLVYIRPN